jgi:hypothetical protein
MDWIANNLLLCKLATWGTLVVEGALWTLVWIKEFRYWILAAAYFFHMGIEYSMNLPLFEGLMITTLIAFVDPKHVEFCVEYAKARVQSLIAAKPQIQIAKPKWLPIGELTTAGH